MDRVAFGGRNIIELERKTGEPGGFLRRGGPPVRFVLIKNEP